MIEIQKCNKCGRRPSERFGATNDPYMFDRDCLDPIHDAADLGPAAVQLLRQVEHNVWCGMGDGCRCIKRQIDALLAAMAPDVKP